jgi:hypothetical protein
VRSPVILLLTAHAVLLGWTSWTKCLGRAETGHLAAAVYFWRMNRFDVFHVNPPLTRMIVSIPVALCNPTLDFSSYSPQPEDRCEWDLGSELLSANSDRRIRWCAFLARCSLIPLMLLGAYCGFLLSRDVYGELSAYVFLVLWCFSPFILAWGATICPDAVAAALGLAAVYAFRHWARCPTGANAAFAGVAMGLLPLTKLTWITAFAVWPLMWCLWRVFPAERPANDRPKTQQPPLKQLCLLLLCALLTINVGYGFDGTFRRLGDFQFNCKMLGGNDVETIDGTCVVSGNRFHSSVLGVLPVPLPTEFVQGVDTQKRDFERGLPSYLAGQWADRGWRYYYLYALAVKEPLGNLCLLAVAMTITVWKSKSTCYSRDEMLVLVLALFLFAFVSTQAGFSINARYILPALAFLYVWISKVGRLLANYPRAGRPRALSAAVLLAITWSTVSSLGAYPHSLSYFNELDGGPRNGGQHLLGSNTEWGQDLRYLKAWIDDHPDIEFDGQIFESSGPIWLLGISESHNPPINSPIDHSLSVYSARGAYGPQPGWYALGVNSLYSRDDKYRYFLNFRPVASAGYSIYIYHIAFDDANEVRRKLGVPEID